jgi:peptide/nickel transport system permease protein
MVMALLITAIIGIPMGIIAALRQDTPLDYILRVLGLAGLSLPSFWLGILVVLILAVGWKWFPPVSYTQPYNDPWLSFRQLIFPAIVLGYRPVGVVLRVLRSSVLEQIRADYTRTANAKGLSAPTIMIRHVLRNSFLPTLTYFGLEAAALLGGVVVIESIFNVPGIGQLLIQALQRRDYPMVEGVLLFILLFVMFINLIIDLLYVVVDPRIRYL